MGSAPVRAPRPVVAQEDADTVKMHHKLASLEARSEYLPPGRLAPKRIAKVSTVGRPGGSPRA